MFATAQNKLIPGYSERVKPPRHAPELSAVAQVEGRPPHQLENLVPAIRTLEERIRIGARCRDADILPKVANSGAVVTEPDGTRVQIMHNGIKVLAGGYYGDWMKDLIARCKGHHEPQEEVLFAEVMKHLGSNATMFELGGFWSFYSIWFLTGSEGRRSVVVEPDPKHIEIGRANARLNGVAPTFINAFVGARAAPPSAFATETSGTIHLPCVTVSELMQRHAIDRLDLLHCDAQGIELAVLESCAELAAAGRLNWVIVSTHSHQISKDPLTHQRCLATLRQAGARVLAEHDVHESFSGDGLILAKFGAMPADWQRPRLSHNRYSESLFRNPLYDLAVAIMKPVELVPAPHLAEPRVPAGTSSIKSRTMTTQGSILVLDADGALGRVGDRIMLPFDKVMFPHVMANAGWSLETLSFLDQHIDPAKIYAVLDIGANIGLFTRQVTTRYRNLTRVFCVEAEPENFRVLQYNVASLLGERVSLHNVALSDVQGETRFFRDRENFGNYSLNDDAMRCRPYDTVLVKSVKTSLWMEENILLQPNEHLIWKSDTQGYDELIVSLTPFSLWDMIDVAIVELWRINKPDFDKASFAARIDSFAHKPIGVGNCCTTADVMAFLDSNDWHHDDLFLWR